MNMIPVLSNVARVGVLAHLNDADNCVVDKIKIKSEKGLSTKLLYIIWGIATALLSALAKRDEGPEIKKYIVEYFSMAEFIDVLKNLSDDSKAKRT